METSSGPSRPQQAYRPDAYPLPHQDEIVQASKGIENVLTDSLSRLRLKAIALSGETLQASQLHERLDDIEPVYALNVGCSVAATLLQPNDEFKKTLVAGYHKDIFFHFIYKAIKEYYANNKNKSCQHDDCVSLLPLSSLPSSK